MKNIIKICLFLAAAVLVSCNKNGRSGDPVPAPKKATLDITINPSVDADNNEKVKTVRIVVFDKVYGQDKLDVNKFIELSSPEDATKLTATTLKVTANDNKMVFVIINEPNDQAYPAPSGYSLKNALDGVMTPKDLEELTFDIAKLLNSDRDMVAANGMPMIGMKRVAVAANEDENNPQKLSMVVERAVARVDVYLEATNGGSETGYTTNDSKVTLHNISYDSYFVMGNEQNGTRDNADFEKNFGKVMKNVTSLTNETWIAPATETWAYVASGNNRRYLESFYVGERLFKSDYSDRLAVTLVGIKKGVQTTGISNKVIETISDGGTPIPFTEIRRNSVYEITAKVGALVPLSVMISVEPWTQINVDVPPIN